MGPLVVVEAEVGTKLTSGDGAAVIGFQMHLLVFHRPPQPLRQDVVLVPSLPVHADLHSTLL